MRPSEPPPPPPEAEDPRPAWSGPPVDVVAGVVPVELLLARTEQRAIGLTGIRAYPNGFAFTLGVRLRQIIPGEQTRFGMFGGEVDPSGEFADYYLRFGVQFADGRTATNLWPHHRAFEAGRPDPPLLTGTGGGGHDGRVWDQDYWVWGLPPPGPLVFVGEWRARGIGESRVQVDARLVLEAAGRAVPIWPEG
jgi:hypothetical protein